MYIYIVMYRVMLYVCTVMYVSLCMYTCTVMYIVLCILLRKSHWICCTIAVHSSGVFFLNLIAELCAITSHNLPYTFFNGNDRRKAFATSLLFPTFFAERSTWFI